MQNTKTAHSNNWSEENVTRIVVASGKGGTGKTLVAANMAWAVSEQQTITLVDCDVEEPNVHLFFPSEGTQVPVCQTIPKIDAEKCTNCGACGEFCQYGALLITPEKVIVNPSLCHACGGCRLVCPEDAITEVPREIGTVTTSKPSDSLTLITGRLKEGEVAAPPVISATKDAASTNGDVIIDGPPGTSCPVIETMEDTDVCIMVTEPTPFGLHDLKLAVGVAKQFKIPSLVVINRSDGSDTDILSFCNEEEIPIVLKIPFSREWAKIQGTGHLIAAQDPTWRDAFLNLFTQAKERAEVKLC